MEHGSEEMPASVFRDVRTIMVVSVVNEQSDQNILQMFIFKGIQSWAVG